MEFRVPAAFMRWTRDRGWQDRVVFIRVKGVWGRFEGFWDREGVARRTLHHSWMEDKAPVRYPEVTEPRNTDCVGVKIPVEEYVWEPNSAKRNIGPLVRNFCFTPWVRPL